jgi:hypothetical protein
MQSVIVFLFLVLGLVGVCSSILGLALVSIGFLEHLLMRAPMMLSHFVRIGVGLLSVGGVSMVMMTGILFFGLSSFKETGSRIFTSMQITSLKKDGLQQHGISHAVLNPQNMKGSVLESNYSEIKVLPLGMRQNTPRNQSKKPCRICLRVKAVLGGGA